MLSTQKTEVLGMKFIFLICFLFSAFARANLDCQEQFVPNDQTLDWSSHHSRKTNEENIQAALHTLSQIKFPFLLELAQNIIKENKGILSYNQFLDIFMSKIIEQVFQFDKNQLIFVLHTLDKLEAIPSPLFIRAWRAGANRQLRAFESLDRYYIGGLFDHWGIPRLTDPFNVNSPPAQRKKTLQAL